MAATAPSRAPTRTRSAPARSRRRTSGAATRKPAPRRRRPRVDGLLRGRQWIVLVGVLLAGIVFLNVGLLELNSGIARTDQRANELKRENAAIRARVGRLSSTERIQDAAVKLGLVSPAPGEVRYLRAEPRIDARRAAQRITAPGPLTPPPAPAPVGPAPVPSAAPAPTAGPAPAAAPAPAAPQPTSAPAPGAQPPVPPVAQSPSAGGTPAG